MSDENLLSILLEDHPFPDKWSARQVLEITTNPIYAGIGPLNGYYGKERISIPEIPAIVGDSEWIEVQVRNIEGFGARNVLRLTRKVLHEALGVKLAALAHHTWLDSSLEQIAHIGGAKYFENLLDQLRPNHDSTQLVVDEVKIKDVTPQLVKQLAKNPSDMQLLPPDKFEDLVCERLSKMGFYVKKAGSTTYTKDGGIDLIAVPNHTAFPFLLAVQVKHHRVEARKTGSRDVRDLLGVLNTSPFHAGLLVTNTTFTPDAQWLAKQHETLIRLRDLKDISRWLLDNFTSHYDWRELPKEIEICPGIFVNLNQLT